MMVGVCLSEEGHKFESRKIGNGEAMPRCRNCNLAEGQPICIFGHRWSPFVMKGDACQRCDDCGMLAFNNHVGTGLNIAPNGDMVNNPPHYNFGGIECIDAIKEALTPEEFRGFCKGNALKYVWRERHKGGIESLKKAQWYLERAVKSERN